MRRGTSRKTTRTPPLQSLASSQALTEACRSTPTSPLHTRPHVMIVGEVQLISSYRREKTRLGGSATCRSDLKLMFMDLCNNNNGTASLAKIKLFQLIFGRRPTSATRPTGVCRLFPPAAAEVSSGHRAVSEARQVRIYK